MTTPLPRPPRRITVHEFYCTYLPELWRALVADLAWPSWGWAATFVVEDSSSETYGLSLTAGQVQAAAHPAPNALVTFRFRRAAWRLAVRDILPRVLRFADGEADRIHAGLAAFARAGYRNVDPESFRAMSGVVELHYTDDAGDEADMTIEVGTGRGPRAQIDATDADLWAVLTAHGRLTPLLRSRVQLGGDAGYVLQLTRALDRATEPDRLD